MNTSIISPTMSPVFITIEGVDGSGKGTAVPVIAQWLEDQVGQACVRQLREPGGTALGEALRELVLTNPMNLETEAMLMFAARAELVRQEIAPALQSGQSVLCDRFIDSSYAYQGGGRSLPIESLQALESVTMRGHDIKPDCTLFFDLPVEVAENRMRRSRSQLDRFETEGMAFFQRVRQAYLSRIEADPDRFLVIDSSQPIDDVQRQIRTGLTLHFSRLQHHHRPADRLRLQA